MKYKDKGSKKTTQSPKYSILLLGVTILVSAAYIGVKEWNTDPQSSSSNAAPMSFEKLSTIPVEGVGQWSIDPNLITAFNDTPNCSVFANLGNSALPIDGSSSDCKVIKRSEGKYVTFVSAIASYENTCSLQSAAIFFDGTNAFLYHSVQPELRNITSTYFNEWTSLHGEVDFGPNTGWFDANAYVCSSLQKLINESDPRIVAEQSRMENLIRQGHLTLIE